MTSVPPSLYTKEITSYIHYLVEDKNAKHFLFLDDVHQDKLTGLGIEALDGDIDILIGHDASKHLASYILSYDPDEKIEFFNAIKESARQHFSDYFDVMISEKRDEIEWRKSA